MAHRAGLEPILDHLHDHVEVRAHTVHLVDERHARDVVAVGLAPHRLRLRLDPGDRVKDRDRAVETRRERSTSMVKSTCPGVSMMLMR